MGSTTWLQNNYCGSFYLRVFGFHTIAFQTISIILVVKAIHSSHMFHIPLCIDYTTHKQA